MLGYEIEGKRILEVGCGLALSSIVLNTRDADITATDHHPEAAANLSWNVGLNGGAVIPFQISDWRNPQDSLGLFDLIIGSDVLYQPDHPSILADFIQHHAAVDAQVILVDPSRGNFARFEKALLPYGFSRHEFPAGVQILSDSDFRGQVRRFIKN